MSTPILLGILVPLFSSSEPAGSPDAITSDCVATAFHQEDAAAILQDPDADLPDRRRILHLDDDGILRGRTRRVAGGWEQRSDRKWIPVLAEIDSHRLEREVLAESRARRAGLQNKEPVQVVELARWMAIEGLQKEAVLELDRVLSDHPDHAGALELLDTASFAATLPGKDRVGSTGWIQALMQEGAGGSPARREQCVNLLAPLKEREGFLDLMRTGMVQANDKHREFALLATRRLLPGQLCEDLARRAILDTMPDVRIEAARGLRDAKDPSWIGPAVRALDSEYDKVRSNAAEALGTMGYAAAVEPLAARLKAIAKQGSGGHAGGSRSNLVVTLESAYVQDYDVEIAQGASIADPIIQTVTSGVIFDVRAQAQRTVVVEWRAVTSSLKQLTKDDPGKGAKPWLKWWEENQSKWRAKDHLPPRPKTPKADASDSGE